MTKLTKDHPKTQKYFPPGRPSVGEVYHNYSTGKTVKVIEIFMQHNQEYVRVQNLETGRRSACVINRWLEYPVFFERREDLE